MIGIHEIIEYDKNIFLTLNGSNSLFWDGFMTIYTSTIIWIPLALILLYVIIKNNNLKETIFIIITIVLVITICDQIASGFFKPYFKRFRPTQDPVIMYLVDIVNGYRGGKYGFISSHAANSFGIFAFVALLLKRREVSFAILIWAIVNAYSRIYLGVHYTGDVICGAIFGCIIGSIMYLFYKYIKTKFLMKKQFFYSANHSTQTHSGYSITDTNILLMTLYSTYFLIIVINIFFVRYNYI